MFVAGNFLIAIAEIANIILTLLYWIIIIRALITWISPDPWNPIVMFLTRVTEPILAPIRNAFPFLSTGIDFSPLIVILGIYFLRLFLVQSLLDLAIKLK